jgi:tRNA modification GTPase
VTQPLHYDSLIALLLICIDIFQLAELILQNSLSLGMSEQSILQRDPIAAIATPVGEGGIAVIRVSGEKAIDKVATIFRGRDLNLVSSHTVHFGHLVRNGKKIDEIVATIFRSPKSYTGEDTVEISCHGGVLVTQEVLEAVLSTGVRAAEPGEFTQRAFLNGKMELSQAEAVADLIHAKSRKAVEAAQQQLDGALGKHIAQFRQQIIDATALVELELDFIEEDVEFASRDQLRKLINELTDEIEKLLSTYETGRLVKHGIRTVFVGKPNAGKSTLLNALMGKDRAIVSDIAGTTRDVIDADWSLDGLLFTLTDTAGLRETEDLIEAEGVKRSHQAMASADLIVYLKDLSERISSAELALVGELRDRYGSKSIIAVGNKIDQSVNPELESEFDLVISAKSGQGIDQLKQLMKSAVLRNKDIDTSGLLVTSTRHRDALEKTHQHLSDALRALDAGTTGDFVSIDLRAGLHELGTITGSITTEDLLDSIFSRFCIGK